MQMFDLPETLNRQEQIFLRAISGIFLLSLEEEFLDEKLMRYDYHFFLLEKILRRSPCYGKLILCWTQWHMEVFKKVPKDMGF